MGIHPKVMSESIAELVARMLKSGHAFDSSDIAAELDRQDELGYIRQEFCLPIDENGNELVYLCGNSLGLQPKRLRALLEEELSVWAKYGEKGHFEHPYGRPWLHIDKECDKLLSSIIGANPKEIAILGGLTGNLHLMMADFYRPTSNRHKILIESKAFPSDYVEWHGYSSSDAILIIEPREGEVTLRTEDIVSFIIQHGSSIALIMLSGVHYYTGQVFDIPSIVSAGHAQGCIVGFDLAHAIGNVPLQLHKWQVDFAAWCSYKYLNSGPGGIAGIFVHERHQQRKTPRLAGWWGHDGETRFKMELEFSPTPGAKGYQLSNPSMLDMTCLLASLQVLGMTDMEAVHAKSSRMVRYFRMLFETMLKESPLSIITPESPTQSGSQISIRLPEQFLDQVYSSMVRDGVRGDKRHPDVIRLAPIALYNTFEDVRKAVVSLMRATQAIMAGEPGNSKRI